MSDDGRFVAFASLATDLVIGDTNNAADVFVHDRETGITTRVSVGPNGTQAAGDSREPAINGDGRFVAFHSSATDLVDGDTNNAVDVFVHDRETATTTRVSVASNGAEANHGGGSASISADGRFVAFHSLATNLVSGDTNNAGDVFVHDRETATTTRVSVGPGGADGSGESSYPTISADGRVVAFQSSATDLVDGDTNNAYDIFAHDRETATTTRVSVGPNGTQGTDHSIFPALSADGRFVAFHSNATSLVDGDTNNAVDVFLHDRETATTTRVSVGPNGTQGTGHSDGAAVSADGRFVAFQSNAGNLVEEDTNNTGDVFVHDREASSTTRVSVASSGTQADQEGGLASISSDGRHVAFVSAAANLVEQPGNGAAQIFVRTLELTEQDTPANPPSDPDPGEPDPEDDPHGPDPSPGSPPDPEPGAGSQEPDPATPAPGSDHSGQAGTTSPSAPSDSTSGYWMLDTGGRVYAFGAAGHFGDPSSSLGQGTAVDVEPTPSFQGYWVIDDRGRVDAYGDARPLGDADASRLGADERVTSLSATPSGAGYWVFTTRGRVIPFGDAAFFGDMAGTVLNGPVLDSIPTPSGRGYYLVASDGGIFAFGDARFYGSMGDTRLNAPVQSVVPDGDGVGYWLVASDGGVFAFDAPFRGSMGGARLNKPVTGMVRFGNGYLMVGEDGGIFNFSDQPFHGSLGNNPPARPIVSVGAH